MGGARDELIHTVTDLVAVGHPVGVIGEAGMGTTTLLERAAAALGGEVVRTGGLRSLQRSPLVPLNRAFGTDLSADPTSLPSLVRAHVGSGVLVIDDLQWADPETLAQLRAVATQARVLVGIRLGDDGAPAARAAVAAAGGTVAALAPLDADECGALARRTRPDAEDAAIDALVRRSAGNPLVLQQLLAGNDLATTLVEALRASVASCDEPSRLALAMLGAHDDGLPAEVIDSPLDALLAAGLVTVRDGVVHLRHQLSGTAASDSLEPGALQDVHRRLAVLTGEPGRRAQHLVHAGDLDAARPLAIEAAERAQGLERAHLLELAAAGAVDSDRSSHLARAALAAIAARHHALGRSLAESALTAAGDAPTGAVLAVVAEARARDGDPAAALEAAGAVAGGAASEDRARALAATARALAWPLWRPTEAVRAAERAVDVGGREHGGAQGSLGLARLVAGDERWQRHPLHLDPTTRIWGTLLSGQPPTTTGASDGPPTDVELLELVLAFHLTADSDGIAARLRRLLDQIERPVDREVAIAHLALALADSGRTAAAADLAATALRAPPSPGGRALLTWALTEAELAGGRLGRARAAAEAVDRSIPSPATTLTVLAATWAAELAPGAGVAAPPPTPGSPWPGLVAADLELAALAQRATAAPAEVAVAFQAAASAWSGWHRRGELRCQWAAADAANRDADDQAASIARLRAVEAEAAPLGQRPLVARVRASLRAAGCRTRPSHGTGRGPLSAREVEVLELVRLGFTSGEAGQALGVAASTIDTQVESAMRKLDARTRLHAAALVSDLER
ncbi:MAG: LuxR C-terminal-related transcriptional regulator [Acidimicrobiales bacterium]